MADIKSKSADEVLKEMNRMPLFMTTLDETDGDGNENMMLEAIKALAYEGTKTEVAENFRQQGNECARAKQWTDAKEFYDKAIAAIKGYVQKVEKDPDAPDESQFDYKGKKIYEVEVDEKEEEEQLKVIEEACYVNRALCNLEKSKLGCCRPIFISSFPAGRRISYVTLESPWFTLFTSFPIPEVRDITNKPQKTTALASKTAPQPSA